MHMKPAHWVIRVTQDPPLKYIKTEIYIQLTFSTIIQKQPLSYLLNL